MTDKLEELSVALCEIDHLCYCSEPVRLQPDDAKKFAAQLLRSASPIPAGWREDMENAPRNRTPVLLRHKQYDRPWAGIWTGDAVAGMPWVSTCYEHAYPEEAFDAWMPIPPGQSTPDGRVSELEAALKCATQHIDHMAEWIASQRQGYSFESLGEDRQRIWGPLENNPAALKGAGS
jgi:hypothetical protein